MLRKHDSNISERDHDMLVAIKKELRDARCNFPTNEDQLDALYEEVGELSQALLQHKHEDGNKTRITKEAVQVAAMAIRIATEGDDSYPYDPLRPNAHLTKVE